MSKSIRKPTPKKRRNDLTLVMGAIVAVGIAVGVGIFVLWRRSGQAGGFPAIATVIPASAQVVIALNTNSEAWQSLGQFGTPPAQQIIGQAIVQSPLSLLLKQGKIEFEQDVQPWLGDRAVTALIPVPNSPPATVVIAATIDDGKSQAFLEKYRSALVQQGANFSEKEANGFKYHVSPSATANVSIVTARLDDKFVVIATSEAVLQEIFNTYRNPSTALAQKEVFQRALAQPTLIPEPLLQAYVDGTIALELVGSQTNLKLNEPTLTASRQRLEAITVNMGIQREGLRWEIDTHLKEQKDNIQPSPNQIIKSLPDSTILFISGSNLAQAWQNLTTQAKGDSSSEQFINQLRQGITNATGWNIEQDLLPWVTGEFAIALVSSSQGILVNSGFGVAIMVQTADPNATKAAMEKLDAQVKVAKGGLFPDGLTVKNSPEAVTWEIGNTVIATRVVTTQGYVLWTTGELYQQFFLTPPRPLPDSPTFQMLTRQLATTNGGYFYLHMTSALGIMEKLIPREVKANPTYNQVRTILDTIEGIAVTSSPLSDRTARLEILFTLKPIPAR